MTLAAARSRDTVAALAGRRIDALGSSRRRFPLECVPIVRERLKRLFIAEKIGTVVCSAACGADLISLDIAHQLGLKSRIVLPFPVERFRQSSVTDRPGEWGDLFDRIIRCTPASDLVVLGRAIQPDEAYEAATQEIIRQATLAAAPSQPFAIAVWEGKDRQGGTDATASFLRHARKAGMKTRTVRTC